MYFLREQLFESLWLLISVAAALCFLSKFSPEVKAFSVLMCINTSLEIPLGKSSASLGKGWGGKHLVTSGMAWCSISNTGAG